MSSDMGLKGSSPISNKVCFSTSKASSKLISFDWSVLSGLGAGSLDLSCDSSPGFCSDTSDKESSGSVVGGVWAESGMVGLVGVSFFCWFI